MSTNMTFIEQAKTFAKDQLKDYDASHDYCHIERVLKVALKLAEEEGVRDAEKLEIIQIAAILHDVGDYKYGKSNCICREFLEKIQYPTTKSDIVMDIMENMSFKNESDAKKQIHDTIEFAIVKDSDRLDAIGAIGIARCFIFSGAKNQKLYDPEIPPQENMTKQEYMTKKSTSVNHFHEKLFKLKDMLLLASSRKIAERRDQYMQQFLDELMKDLNGEV